MIADIFIVIIIIARLLLADEVLGALVFVRATILVRASAGSSLHADRDTHVVVSTQDLVDVCGGKLVELLVVAEYDDGDVD